MSSSENPAAVRRSKPRRGFICVSCMGIVGGDANAVRQRTVRSEFVECCEGKRRMYYMRGNMKQEANTERAGVPGSVLRPLPRHRRVLRRRSSATMALTLERMRPHQSLPVILMTDRWGRPCLLSRRVAGVLRVCRAKMQVASRRGGVAQRE
jgi:hypothetical protein